MRLDHLLGVVQLELFVTRWGLASKSVLLFKTNIEENRIALPDTSPLISPRLRQTICSVDHEGLGG